MKGILMMLVAVGFGGCLSEESMLDEGVDGGVAMAAGSSATATQKDCSVGASRTVSVYLKRRSVLPSTAGGRGRILGAESQFEVASSDGCLPESGTVATHGYGPFEVAVENVEYLKWRVKQSCLAKLAQRRSRGILGANEGAIAFKQ